MSLFKRGSIWWFTFQFNGRRIQRSSKVENRRVAEDIERAFRTNLARGEVDLPDPDEPKAERLAIGVLLDDLKADYGRRGKANVKNLNTIARVRQDFEKKLADSLSAKDLNAYIDRRQAAGAAGSTINHALQVLSSAFKLAEIPWPKVKKLEEKNIRTGFFSREEFDRVSHDLPSDLRDFCLFGYLTGWRKNAIATLAWSDVHDGNVYLRAVRSKNGKPYFVPIMGELANLIERRREARSIKSGSGVELSGLVFHRDGRQIEEFRKSWETACSRAGVGRWLCKKCLTPVAAERRCPKCKAKLNRGQLKYDGRVFHDLRRSAARNLIRSGVSRSVAMKITGHLTEAMFERYNITDEADLRDAMEKVELHHQAEQKQVVRISSQG
jgi:integrase